VAAVDSAGAMTAALEEQRWDVITCEYVLPNSARSPRYDCIQRLGLDLPVIIVSGQVGEEVAVSAMKAGAHDYVSKHRLARLVPAIERELRDADIRRARRRVEETPARLGGEYPRSRGSLRRRVRAIAAGVGHLSRRAAAARPFRRLRADRRLARTSFKRGRRSREPPGWCTRTIYRASSS
jgi:DNA-binding NtrC family response regulator